MSYKIKLPVFEGPFDLLLFLIKKDEIDVYNIPIAEITHQYLEYLELMRMLDLDIAGEFIEMVATLMLIKVRMLLPRTSTGEDEEIEDPRAQLVSQLLDYQRFKEASFEFSDLENRRRKYFSRPIPVISNELIASEKNNYYDEASLFDLLKAFKIALDSMPKVTMHQVNVVKVTLEQQVKFVFQKFGEQSYILFSELRKGVKTKMELIVTFMSLLDLIRLQFLSVKQSDIFGEIRLVAIQPLNFEKYLEERDRNLITRSQNAEMM